VKLSYEKLWNLAAWRDVSPMALAIMASVSVFAAAHYLAAMGVPLGMARRILLGI